MLPLAPLAALTLLTVVGNPAALAPSLLSRIFPERYLLMRTENVEQIGQSTFLHSVEFGGHSLLCTHAQGKVSLTDPPTKKRKKARALAGSLIALLLLLTSI